MNERTASASRTRNHFIPSSLSRARGDDYVWEMETEYSISFILIYIKSIYCGRIAFFSV